MEPDRRLRLWTLVVAQARDGPVAISHLCTVAMSTAKIDGAAVTVTLDAGAETLYTSDVIAADLAELSLTFGEGPAVDAGTGGPVLAGDLTDVDSRNRWPMFAPAAVSAGGRAVFALPLRVGGIRLGVFTLHRDVPGPLDRGALSDALMLADTACGLLLDAVEDNQPDNGRPERAGPGIDGRRERAGPGLDGRLDPAASDGHGLAEVGLQHPEVHQATGMIIAQLGVPAAVALIRLRAYAYAHDRHVHEVARDVVARRLRFHPDGAR